MHGTTTRYLSGRDRDGGERRTLWRFLALAVGAGAVAVGIAVLARDVEWRHRGREAVRLGDGARDNGNYEAARDHYLRAIADNPYDWEAHHRLAAILNHCLNDHEGALRHYLLALAYSPDPGIVDATTREVTILRLMRAGELENPAQAIEDMFQAVESNARSAFVGRLDDPLWHAAEAYWQGWLRRGRGKVAAMKIASVQGGHYHAAVELGFPDETSMLLHLRCPPRDVWRLNLGFP